MEVSINIVRQGSRQREENFRKWKAESFPPDLRVPSDTEPKKMMDEKPYTYAKEDRFDELFRDLHPVPSLDLPSIIYRHVGPSGNSLLHVAASHGSKYVTELLLHHFPPLITTKNFQDDTALHLAARGGQLRTTEILVNEAKSPGGKTNTFMEMKNDRGNTALHDAVINCHQDVARSLVSEHWKLSYMENNEHKSPLYLAVETSTEKQSDGKMLGILMDAISDEVDLLKTLEGKSPVHAAVQRRKKSIVKQIANKKPQLLRRKDEKGANALHCAASMGYVFETGYLFDEYRDGAIEQNGEGNLPIHVASQKGHVDVVDEYISKWTDPTEFLNSKGQNILHVAAESGQFQMVKYILENNKLQALVNEKDRDGNTPLHLASKNGRSMATFTLVRNKMVMKEIANGENLTPYQVVKKQSKIVGAEFSSEPIPNGKDNQVDRKSDNNAGKEQTKGNLDNHGVDNQVDQKNDNDGGKQEPKSKLDYDGVDNQVDQKNDKDGGKQEPKSKLDYYGVMMTLSILHFYAAPKKSIVEYLRYRSKPLPKEEIKSRIEALLVVAVLIASVTFSGVLQLPESGSDTTSPQNQGISAENEAILRDVYIYLDLIALNASVMAAIILCWAQLYGVKVAAHAVWVASILTGGAIYLMCLAFMFAVAINVGENFAFFVVALIVGGGFVFVQTVISAPLIIPPSANQIIERIVSPYIYFAIFRFYLVFEWLLSKCSKRCKKCWN